MEDTETDLEINGGGGHGCYGDLSLWLPGLTSQPVTEQSAFTIQVKRCVMKHQTLIFDKLTSGYSNKPC